MTDESWIIDRITRAGTLARDSFDHMEPNGIRGQGDESQLDREIQSYLCDEFTARFPEDGIVAEEGRLRKTESAIRTWVIDPIDGTASFMAGFPVWGISVAAVVNGEAEIGFCYLPTTGDLFYTRNDGRVCKNGSVVALNPPRPLAKETCLLVGSRFHVKHSINPSFPGKLLNFGSKAAHTCFVAAGSADVVLIEGAYLWDFAAGWAMLRRNGGVVRYLNGRDAHAEEFVSGERVSGVLLGGHPETIARLAPLVGT